MTSDTMVAVTFPSNNDTINDVTIVQYDVTIVAPSQRTILENIALSIPDILSQFAPLLKVM